VSLFRNFSNYYFEPFRTPQGPNLSQRPVNTRVFEVPEPPFRFPLAIPVPYYDTLPTSIVSPPLEDVTITPILPPEKKVTPPRSKVPFEPPLPEWPLRRGRGRGSSYAEEFGLGGFGGGAVVTRKAQVKGPQSMWSTLGLAIYAPNVSILGKKEMVGGLFGQQNIEYGSKVSKSKQSGGDSYYSTPGVQKSIFSVI
jgi:hypothetical protein